MSPQRLSVRKNPTSRHLITFYTNQCRVKLKWTLLNIYGRYREKGRLSTTFTFCRTNSRSLLGWPAIWDVREAGSIRSETRVYFYKWFRKLTFLSVYCWQASKLRSLSCRRNGKQNSSCDTSSLVRRVRQTFYSILYLTACWANNVNYLHQILLLTWKTCLKIVIKSKVEVNEF